MADENQSDEQSRKKTLPAEVVLKNSQPIENSLAEKYLRRRGIRVPVPPSLLFKPSFRNYPAALVAVSTDYNGKVLAIQTTAIGEDGRKAQIPVVKKTNKITDDWARDSCVRFPGTKPIILTEGVEDALSIWQSTGRECHACFGIEHLAKYAKSVKDEICIARDGDQPGSGADKRLRKIVKGRLRKGLSTKIACPPVGRDFNDILVESGDEMVKVLISDAVPGDQLGFDWKTRLRKTSRNGFRCDLANVMIAFRNSPALKGVVWYDEFRQRVVASHAKPWQLNSNKDKNKNEDWTDDDDLRATVWLQLSGLNVTDLIVGKAVETIAKENNFHPVREYLGNLEWDLKPRLHWWLSFYLGPDNNKYVSAVGKKWIISAVARIYQPGVKVDHALILEGPQGLGKSTALNILAGPWFTDQLSDLSNKDSAMELSGRWIIEIAELDSLNRSDTSTIKAYISRNADQYRPPYGKRVVKVPRQCVFSGTVNPNGGYLKDPTGGRRFWPVTCVKIDLEALMHDRDQLWAEAKYRYDQGEKWWLEDPELIELAISEQADRYQGDSFEVLIEEYIETRISRATKEVVNHQINYDNETHVTIKEVLEHAVGLETSQWTQINQNRVSRALGNLGFVKKREKTGDVRKIMYVRPIR